MQEKKGVNKTKALKKKRFFIICLFLFLIIFVSALFTHYSKTTKEASKTKETATIANEPVENAPAPVETRDIVCLDPGHGGNDVGAIYGGIYESHINLTVAIQTKSILEKAGYLVYLTRTGDDSEAKRDRSKYCNSVKADVFVSIHHNSYDSDHSVNYATALYYKKSDQLLASSVLGSTSEKLAVESKGISKFNNSILWVADMPATLIESFFMTNKNEYYSLLKATPTRLSDEADGIATGIINYLTRPEEIKTFISDDPLIINRIDLEE